MNPSSDPLAASSSDKTWVLCAYLFTPLLPAVMLLMEDVKKRPYIRAHLAQSLVLGIAGFVVNSLLMAILIGCITWPLYLVLLTYYGVKAYHGEKIQIPVISEWVTGRGWD